MTSPQFEKMDEFPDRTKANIQLRHLTLVPRHGMCNRLRAIASVRRLCRQLEARCSVVWEWGKFEDFFAAIPDLEFIDAPYSGTADKKVIQRSYEINPTRAVDVTVKSLELHSGFVFWGSHERPIRIGQILPYLPTLNSRLQDRVDEFKSCHLKNAVGFHIRRTDHKHSIYQSPDNLFFEKAREVISAGKKIFLATDNLDTESKMKNRFRDA